MTLVRCFCAAAIAGMLAGGAGPARAGEAGGGRYEEWNAFCAKHFGAEKEPLVYELYGKQMKTPAESVWTRASESSATVAWETTLPAKAHIEYGETDAYGSKTPESERCFYIHVHYLKGLKKNMTYHYRTVSVDERGNTVASADQTLQTKDIEGAVHVPGDMGGPPYALAKAGATYVVTKDMTIDGRAFEITGANVTLDLNGHTVVYDNKKMGKIQGDHWPHIKSSAFGVIANKVGGLKIFGGTLRQGKGDDAAHKASSIGFNPIYCKNVTGAEVAGVTLDYGGSQMIGLLFHWSSGRADIHHNVFLDRAVKIDNRHGSACRSLRIEGKQDGDVHHNLVKRTRQMGLLGAAKLYNNEIYVDSFSTNSFATGIKAEGGEGYNNRIFATGFNPYGFGWGKKDWKAHHNFVHMHGIDAKSRWHERWGDISTLEGFRVTNYGKGRPVRDNLQYWKNVVVLSGQDGSELRGTGFFSDTSITRLDFNYNIVKVMARDDKTVQAACLSAHGNYKKADKVLPVYYRRNTLISNICNVRFGDSYGKGSNHRIVDCKLVKVGDHPRYHTFAFSGAYWCKRNVIQDCTFEGGARYNDVEWQRTGKQSFYDVRWTLSLKVPEGAKVAITDATGAEVDMAAATPAPAAATKDDGAVAIALDQCRIAPGGGNQPHTNSIETKKTPHTVTVTAGGKTATATVEMTKKRFLEFRGGALVEYTPAKPAAKSAGKASAKKTGTRARPAPGGNGNGAAKAAKLYRSARSAERSGMKGLARTLYGRLVKEYPDSPLAEKARAKLK